MSTQIWPFLGSRRRIRRPAATLARLAVLLLFGLGACEQEQASSRSPAPGKAEQAPVAIDEIPPPPSGQISGRLELSGKVADAVEAGDVIYVIARNAATSRTIAVSRLAAPEKFPLPFALGEDNVMIPGNSLAGKVRVLARVDKDGDALSKNAGDVVGKVDALVEVPANDVVINLDEVLTAEN